MTIYRLDVKDFAFWELDRIKDLLNIYLESKNNQKINWFIKKIIYNNTIPDICLVDDDNNYYHLENNNLVKLDNDEKKGFLWSDQN